MKENGNALLWVLLVLFPPIGIIYMWVKKKDFPQKKKIILSVVFAIWTIILIAFGSGGTTENTTTNSNSKNETVTDAKKEDKDSTPVKKVEAVEVTGDLLTTPAFTAEANTSDMVDQIALTAKKYADTLTDEQVATILADVKTPTTSSILIMPLWKNICGMDICSTTNMTTRKQSPPSELIYSRRLNMCIETLKKSKIQPRLKTSIK